MAAWLDITTEATGWTLVDTGRLESLVNSMENPRNQYPSLVYFVGGASRHSAMRALFPRNNVTRKGLSSFLNLHLSTEAADQQHPILFMEGNYIGDNVAGTKDLCRWPTEKLHHYPMKQRPSSIAKMQQNILSHFVLPWTQLVCFFVENTKDIDQVRQFLETPRCSIKVGSQNPSILMQIIVVLGSKKLSWNDEKVKKMFPSEPTGFKVTVMDLRERYELSPTAAFAPLRSLLNSLLEEAQSDQQEHGLLFSAEHFRALWDRTLIQGVGLGNEYAMDALAIARENKQLNVITTDHIKVFLTEAIAHGYRDDDLHSFLATAFLMNAYPPNMHGFQCQYIFKELYEQPLLNALKSSPSILSESNTLSVLRRFTALRFEMSPGISSSRIRGSFLSKAFSQYGGLYSTATCLVCLSRCPEHMLSCFHAICETCVVIFGNPSRKAEYEFELHRCPLCYKKCDFLICQLPPTKRPVVLSLDGGGIRGIIQLGLLRSLEKRTGKLGGVIDLYVGTSVGALNAMDFVFNKSSAEDSFRKFPELAHQIFVSSNSCWQTSLFRVAPWVRFISGFLSDGQYDDKNLEDLLKRLLGSDRRIFDDGTTLGAGSKIAIITSRTSDGKACVFANYRGVGTRNTKSAYQFLFPQTPDQNPFLWEVARCSVAAPLYFKTKTLPGFGSLQDGGVRANNPLPIALRESTIVWPEAEGHDLLISVGTGSTCTDEFALENTRKRGIHDTAVPRLIRAAMASPSMDGEQGFFEALNFVPDHMRDDIYRLDQPIPDELPRLDDVTGLKKLAELNYTVPDSLVRAILVTGFYFFELDEKPLLKQGLFRCEGSILCKSHNSESLLDRVRHEFPGAQFRVANGDYLGFPDDHNGCEKCGYYRKKCTFTVNNLDESFTIELSSPYFRQKIGGFPKSVRNLLADQQSLSYFGRVDHSVDSWPPRRVCFCSRGTRRKVQFLDVPLAKKRRQ